ncbi:MAG: phosphoribosylamine--glycine ligase [Candidatus Woesearchaeota archaeon]
MARVMILGSGGREHALAWWFKKYGHEVHVAPGNAGTAIDCRANIDLNIHDFDDIDKAAVKNSIDLVVVGPEDALVNGIVDYWERSEARQSGIKIFGPPMATARLEGSKIFARRFAEKYGLPIPEYLALDSGDLERNLSMARRHLTGMKKGMEKELLVVKADGLCAGKGVYVNKNLKELEDCLGSLEQFGNAATDFLLEERLVGEEVSITLITDGISYKAFHHSQDHKRRFDGDRGPNTGGMGAYAPTRLVTPELERIIAKEVINPTIRGIREEGLEYNGILYIALMIQDNRPYLIEYNCRFGDPETQVIVPLVDADPFRLMMDCIYGRLDKTEFALRQAYSCCVVLVGEDYPIASSKGEEISYSPSNFGKDDIFMFHAGTKMDGGTVVTAGGRIMGITAISDIDHEDAIGKAYRAEQKVCFAGKDFRNDIGYRVRGKK